MNLKRLKEKLISKSASFKFNYTRYYEKEMGVGLEKQFFSFKSLGSPEQLIDRKRRALELGKKFSKGGLR